VAQENLRLHILSLLSKEAKKLRLSQVQAKILVQNLRLRLLPVWLQVLRASCSIADWVPITYLIGNRDSETKNRGACALTRVELFITYVRVIFYFHTSVTQWLTRPSRPSPLKNWGWPSRTVPQKSKGAMQSLLKLFCSCSSGCSLWFWFKPKCYVPQQTVPMGTYAVVYGGQK
jgi:hypothetical protein